MGDVTRFTVNFSEYCRSRNYGELTEVSVDRLKEKIGRPFLVQLPFTISEEDIHKKLEIFLSKISNLWTCVGISEIIDVRQENNIVVMVCDVIWAKAYRDQPPTGIRLSPAGIVSKRDSLNCIFNLAGFVLMPE